MTKEAVPLIAALLTGVLGFAGSWIGAQIGLLRFKRERAFDKQLDWYERAIRAMNRFGEAIEIAGTFQNERDTKPEQLAELWIGVQSAHLEFSRVAQEVALFGSPVAVTQISRIDKMVQNAADGSKAFDPPKIDANHSVKILSDIYELPAKLEKARLGVDHRSATPPRP